MAGRFREAAEELDRDGRQVAIHSGDQHLDAGDQLRQRREANPTLEPFGDKVEKLK